MAYQIVGAYILDIILGDPYWFPHPVKFIGKAVEYLEKRLRQFKMNLKSTGIILAILIIASTYAAVYFIIYLFNSINIWLGLIITSVFVYTALSVKSLGREGQKIYDLLKKDKLQEAKEKLSMLVGRDTKNLDEGETIRATVETIAENTVDGVISPLFYACLGGAPLALAYKAINTLDSMVGYKNEQYRELGWFSAKLDDIANWMPARLSAVFIPLAAAILKMPFKQPIKTIIKDGNKSPSPNAGIPESGFAGALGIQLGGINYYEGMQYTKPIIGIKYRDREKRDIISSIHLMYVVSLLVVVSVVILFTALKGIC